MSSAECEARSRGRVFIWCTRGDRGPSGEALELVSSAAASLPLTNVTTRTGAAGAGAAGWATFGLERMLVSGGTAVLRVLDVETEKSEELVRLPMPVSPLLFNEWESVRR